MSNNKAGLNAYIETIETIADNKFVLGDLLVEIGIGGPGLEATLSAIAMAQGELGHSRLLYNWASDLKGVEKTEIKDQTGKAFANVVASKDWIDLIASLYAVNTGFEIVLRTLLEGGHSDVVNRVSKLLKEQKEHIMYSRGWAQQLQADQGAIPKRMNESLNRVIPEVQNWLKKLDATVELVNGGFMKSGAKLESQFEAQVSSLNAKRAELNVI